VGGNFCACPPSPTIQNLKLKRRRARRARRENICRALFGQDIETMIGVVVIAIGGALAGIMLTHQLRNGWDFGTVVGGPFVVAAVIGLGMLFLPKRRGD
jgi:hypothetical protein